MQKNKTIKIRSIIIANVEYIAIDDFVQWLKGGQSKINDPHIHTIIKALVMIKNQKQ